MNKKIISNRVNQRLEKLNFFLSEPPVKGRFLSQFEYLIPNSNGKIEFFYNLSTESTATIITDIGFWTNINGVELAFLDVSCELLKNKNLSNYHLTLREVENYLRDDNAESLIEGINHNLNRVFSFLPEFYNTILPASEKMEITLQSPEFSKTYLELKEDFKNEVGFEKFASFSSDEKAEAIDSVLDRYIRASLKSDGGDAHCVHYDNGMIVIEYSGNCSSCDSSLTSTIDYIQDVFRSEFADPSIMVVTDS